MKNLLVFSASRYFWIFIVLNQDFRRGQPRKMNP
jgi:hypothetical protein